MHLDVITADDITKTKLPKEILLNLSNISFDNYVFRLKCIAQTLIFEDHLFDYGYFLKSRLLIQDGRGCSRVNEYYSSNSRVQNGIIVLVEDFLA